MMLPEHGPGIIVKLKLLSCKKINSLLDASFHISVNQNDNHHGQARIQGWEKGAHGPHTPPPPTTTQSDH